MGSSGRDRGRGPVDVRVAFGARHGPSGGRVFRGWFHTAGGPLGVDHDMVGYRGHARGYIGHSRGDPVRTGSLSGQVDGHGGRLALPVG